MYAQTLFQAVAHGYGVERPFLCPVHGDSRPSASLNIVKGKWYCYTCGAHGALTGESALLEPDYQQMKLWLSRKLEEQRVYPEAWLSRWDAGPVHPYWVDRVGKAAARTFRLGFDHERGELTYPLRRTDGAVLGVVHRKLDGDGPKYRYPRGIDIGKLLFNYSHEAHPTVVLCEGAMDAIALWRVGVRAFAIYGARLSAEQVRLIDRVDPDHVFTAFDIDDAGEQASDLARRSLRHRAVHRLTWPAEWGKDVDEIGMSRLSRLVEDVLELQGEDCIDSSAWPSKSSEPMKPSREFSISTSKPEKQQSLQSTTST